MTFPLGSTGLVANDSSNKAGARATDANRYMMDAYLKYVLPKKPDLSLIWFREPDSTEHAYGPGSANYKLALAAQDDRLKALMAGLLRQQPRHARHASARSTCTTRWSPPARRSRPPPW